AVALLDIAAGRGLDVLEVAAGGVAVGVDGLAAFAAEELIHGHAGPLAEDVPQGHVHAADGVVEHRAVAPVGADERGLPDVLDLGGVLADEERLEEAVDGGLNHASALGEGGTAQAVEPRLAGGHLDDDKADLRGGG